MDLNQPTQVCLCTAVFVSLAKVKIMLSRGLKRQPLRSLHNVWSPEQAVMMKYLGRYTLHSGSRNPFHVSMAVRRTCWADDLRGSISIFSVFKLGFKTQVQELLLFGWTAIHSQFSSKQERGEEVMSNKHVCLKAHSNQERQLYQHPHQWTLIQ